MRITEYTEISCLEKHLLKNCLKHQKLYANKRAEISFLMNLFNLQFRITLITDVPDKGVSVGFTDPLLANQDSNSYKEDIGKIKNHQCTFKTKSLSFQIIDAEINWSLSGRPNIHLLLPMSAKEHLAEGDKFQIV